LPEALPAAARRVAKVTVRAATQAKTTDGPRAERGERAHGSKRPEPGRPDGEPDEGPRAEAHARRRLGVQPAGRLQHPAQGPDIG
jgi:hypothetical protein